MVKKEGLLVFVVLFVFILFMFGNVSAIDPDSIGQQIDKSAKKIEGGISGVENFATREDIRKEYLRNAWDDLLMNKTGFLGGSYRTYKKVSPYTDPTFEYVVGMKPEFSWYFLLVFVICFMLMKYFFTFYEVLRDFSTFSKNTSMVISLGFFVILIVMQFFKNITLFFAEKLVSFAETMSDWKMQLLLVLGFVLFVLYTSYLSKYVKRFARKFNAWNENRKKENKREMMDIEQSAGIKEVKMITDAVKEGLKDD